MNKNLERQSSQGYQKDTLTLEETAQYLGMSKSWLYKLTSQKQVPHYKPSGKMCYFDRVEIDTWVRSNRVTPMCEIQEQAQSYCMQKGGRK